MKKNKKRLIWLSVIIILALLFGLFRYYIYIMSDEWKQESMAIVAAKQHSELVQVTRTSKSVWNNVVWVIEGKDQEEKQLIVWVPLTSEYALDETPGAIHTEWLVDGMTKDQMLSIVNKEDKSIKKVHLELGLFNGTAVWQMFYKEVDHYRYRFYRFTDGTPIDEQFTLPNS
ncbi:cell wall elongation regulator TseB-like domain-containing protein [Paenibacillus sp. CMAA1364]